MCVYIKQEKIYKFILYRIRKVIFFLKWFFLPVSTSPLGNKGKDKTNQKSPGLQSFSSVLWKHLATRRLCWCVLWICSQFLFWNLSSSKHIPRKCCYQILFVLLQLIILLLGTQDLGWRRKFKLRVHFLWSQRLSLLLGVHLNPMPMALPSVPLLVAPENFILLANKT